MQTILSTEQVEEWERFAYWREMICDVFVQLDASQLSRQRFAGRIATGSLEDIQISELSADPQHVVRSKRQIAKSREDYFLVSLQTAGQSYTEQDQREARLRPGDFVLYDSTRPYVLHFEQPFQQIVFRFPRSLLLARCGQAERMTSVRIPGTQHPVSALVSTLLRTVASSYLYLDSITRVRVVESTLDLLTTSLSTVTGVKLNESNSMANVHRVGARAFISAHLSDPDLTPSLVAASQGISTRYLHKLFEAEGQSVAAFIRNRRLEQCRRDLADRKQIQRTVTDIAFQWGFNDVAHFSRIFKHRFGVSPTEYRNAALNTSREEKRSKKTTE
ncbi:transcriptional regulator FeaR [Aneurinibacillus terranovensis]|uniref:transcriptional regulator FeaR n=1 Tax=Aneurinibacillus terranovensis TaxID=278991 RepID=UPI00041C2575|nr:transcriptional regulator FeaR [Aneurinibacillus terranovensis]